ncbi:hypothetical protein RI367_008202 [Sorochytrium milnesiophthora]
MNSNRVDHRLPPEVTAHIAALCGVRVCAVLRHLPALQLILRAYKRGRNRSTAHEQTAIEVLLRHKWNGGVQAVLDAGIYHTFDCDEDLWRGIKLTPASIRQLWRTPNIARHRLATVVYNLIETSEDGAEELLQWCASRSRLFCIHLGHELLERGGTLAMLRDLCRRTGIYLDERQLAQDFLSPAAGVGHLEALQDLVGTFPELVLESPSPLVAAASFGHLPVVQFLAAGTQQSFITFALYNAADNNHIDIVVWLHEQCPQHVWLATLGALARHGHLDFLKRLWQDNPDYHSSTQLDEIARGAVHGNQIAVLEWAFQQQEQGIVPNWTIDVAYSDSVCVTPATAQWIAEHCNIDQVRRQFVECAQHNQRQVVEWITATRLACTSVHAIPAAISHGHFELALWLSQQLGSPLSHCHLTVDCLSQMAFEGRLSWLQWIEQHIDFSPDQEVVAHALASGNVDLADWLFRVRPHLQITDAEFDGACHTGHLPMVQWAFPRLESQETSSEALDVAAAQGHLQMLEWLHSHTDLPCTTAAMDDAAGLGRLDIVQLLHTHRTEGCSSRALSNAAAGGHIDVLIWLRENCAPECTTNALLAAIAGGLLSVVRWLSQRYPGTLKPTAMDLAAKEGRLDILQFLHAECGATCTTDAMDFAASAGHIDTVRWLHTHRSEGCTEAAMAEAAEHGNLSVVRFLAEHGYPVCAPNVFCHCSPYVMEGIGPRDDGAAL